MKPATPLPYWSNGQGNIGSTAIPTSAVFADVRPTANPSIAQQDAAYIVHAANAYPKLVAALGDITRLIDAYPRAFNAEEINMRIYLENAHVLLRELAESDEKR